MKFETLLSLSKNKASVGDRFVIETGIRTVTQITTKYTYLDNGTYYPKKLFNRWMRIANDIAYRDKHSIIKYMKADEAHKDAVVMRKESKEVYDEKYREPGVNRMGKNTSLKLYIVLSGVGNTVKFYFSPTFKADPEDLESSYRSLHGTSYKAFAWGYYIQHENNIALIGMYSYKDEVLTEKRVRFAMNNVEREIIDGKRCHIRLYPSFLNLFHSNPPPSKHIQLLSSTV
jgi:hypothetical protein